MSNDFVRRSAADTDKRLDAEKLQVENLDVHRLRVMIAPVTLKYEDVGGGVTYVGEAVPGTALSAAGWRIKKVLTTVAGVDILWADGDSNFDNVWDDRASLTYTP